MKYKLIGLLIMVVVLPACATKWIKPGATEQEFHATRSVCTRRAAAAYPPLLDQMTIGVGYTTPRTTNCSGSGYYVNCQTYGGQYVPPSRVTVDRNQSERNNDITSCFYENGWRPEK